MARIRYLPFGYRIQNGDTVIHEQEAECIRMIYNAYIDGASYTVLAEKMQALGVPYHSDTPVWNKHMIKRMLENERYTGEKEYPAIISRDLFERVNLLRESKRGEQKPKKPVSEPVFIPSVSVQPLPDITITRLENQINHELGRPVMEPERLREMIFRCAVLKYDNCLKAQNQIAAAKTDADSARFDI